MKLSSEGQRLNSCALQVLRERLHLAPYIGEMRIAELRHDQPAALDVDFNPVQCGGEIVQGLIGRVQTLKSSRVVPVIQSFRAKQQMKAPKRMDEPRRPRIRSWRARVRRGSRERSRRVPYLWRGLRTSFSLV